MTQSQTTASKISLRKHAAGKLHTAILGSVFLSASLLPLQAVQADSGTGWGHHNTEDRDRHHREGMMVGYGPMGYGAMGYGGMGYGMSLFDLDLTRTQREKMQEIMESHHESLRGQFKAQQSSHYDLMTALVEGADSKTLNRLLEQQNQQHAAHQKAHIEMMQQLMTVLTEAQKAELKKRLE